MTAVSNDLAGYLTKVVTPQGTLHYVYDAATGRVVETWTGTSSVMTDTLYGYDAQGRLASVTVARQNGSAPSLTSSAISYFDAKGDAITPSSNLPTTLYSYDADGNVTTVAYPNGTETDTNYSSYWATGTGGVFGTETITNKRGSTTLSSFQYQFDADRRKISDLETMTDSGEASTSTALFSWSYTSSLVMKSGEIKITVPENDEDELNVEAKMEGRRIGYAGCERRGDRLQLCDLRIDENQRRRGIGTAMLRLLLDTADETGIEFCDLFGAIGSKHCLIHVKEANGAELRALFAQGSVSGADSRLRNLRCNEVAHRCPRGEADVTTFRRDALNVRESRSAEPLPSPPRDGLRRCVDADSAASGQRGKAKEGGVITGRHYE